MTLHAFDTTVERIPGTEVTVRVPIWSSEPGTVTASAPGCTFPDGETVVIAGTREYRPDGRGGDYLAISDPNPTRYEVSFLFRVDLAKLQSGSALNFIPYNMIAASIDTAATARINWAISIDSYKSTPPNQRYICRFARSINSSTNDAAAIGPQTQYASPTIVRYAITYFAPDTLRIYEGALATMAPTGLAAPTGAIGGTEVMYLKQGIQFLKYDRKLSDADLDLWFAGTIPASPAVAYLGNHEIVDGAQKIWDSAGTRDLTTAVSVPGWGSPAMTIRNVDDPGDPVVPASSIRVTIPAGVASPVTLTLSRPRQGVPSRASEAERIESATGTITITDIPAKVFCGPSQEVRTRL